MVSAIQQNQMLNASQQNPVILVKMEVQHETAHLKEKDVLPCFPHQGNCSTDSQVYDVCHWSDAIQSIACLNHVYNKYNKSGQSALRSLSHFGSSKNHSCQKTYKSNYFCQLQVVQECLHMYTFYRCVVRACYSACAFLALKQAKRRNVTE